MGLFEAEGKFLQGLAGDFLVHIESTQRCLATVEVTGAATAPKGNVFGLAADGTVIPSGGVMANITQFAVGPGPAPGSGLTANHTVINDYTGAVLNQTVLLQAGYSSVEVGQIVAAVTAPKWVTEPVKTDEQIGGTKTTS